MKRLFALAVLGFAMLLGGCAGMGTMGLMNQSHDQKVGGVSWKNYSDAKSAFDRIENNRTTLVDLKSLGVDLKTLKNTDILPKTKYAPLLAPLPQMFDALSSQVKHCLVSLNDPCVAYVVQGGQTEEKQKGSIILDLIDAKEESSIRWWSAEMMLLVNGDGVVVAKFLGGTPDGERDKGSTHWSRAIKKLY